jgi:competence protein ComEC
MVFSFFGAFKKAFRLKNVSWLLLLSLSGRPLTEVVPAQWIVWNVGQGSWLTRVEARACIHFDAGGEGRAPPEVLAICKTRRNLAAFSHSDWDHISFAKILSANFADLCRDGPRDKIKKNLRAIPPCHGLLPWWAWHPDFAIHNANDASGVYEYRGLLYPGDSPKKLEKYWIGRVPRLAHVRILVLAHHGSRTGTSSKLLAALPRLEMAVASARRAKYGHPHGETVERLRAAHVPLLRTEHWGNLHFLDKPPPSMGSEVVSGEEP